MITNTRNLVAVLALATAANAQLTNFDTPESNDVLGAWNTLTAPGTFHDVLHADFGGSLDYDVVYRTDDGILFCTEVVIGGRSFAYSHPSISAMALWPDASGDVDLLLAGPQGITVLEIGIDTATSTVALTTKTLFETAVAGLTDLVHVPGSLPQNDYWIGLAADKRTLVEIQQDANTSSGLSVNSNYSAACASDGWELESVDFEDDGVSEVAVLTQAGLALFTRTGATPQLVHPLVDTKGMIRAISTGTANQIAWIRRKPNLEYEVAVATNSSLSTTSSLGTRVPVGASAGDFDGDGNTDLALSQDDASELLLLKNIGGVINMTSHQLVSTGRVPSSNNQSQPLALDFDGDNNVDLLSADASHPALVYFKSASGLSGTPIINYFQHTSATTGSLVMQTYGSHHTVDPLVTHMIVTTSEQVRDSAGNWSTPSALSAVRVQVQRARSGAPFATAAVVTDDPLISGGSQFITHFMARFVRVENGLVVQVWPAVFGVLLDPRFTDAAAYLAYVYPGATYPAIIDLETGNGEKAGKTKLPPKKLPPLPPLPTGN